MPEASVDGDHVMVAEPSVTLLAATLAGAVGGVLSA